MNDANIEQLVERAKNGDRSAAEEIYKIYREPLRKYVIKLGLSEFDAEDVVSETFIAMLNNIGNVENNSQIGTWLHSIAKNKAFDLKAKDKAHPRVGFEVPDEEGDSSAKPDGNAVAIDIGFQQTYGDTVMLPENYAENADIREIIAGQIQSLSPMQRETLFLFYYQNKSVAEISELTGSSQNTVKVSLSNARKTLKTKLEELRKKGIVLCAVPFPQFISQFENTFSNAAAAGAAGASGTAGTGSAASAQSGASASAAVVSSSASSAAAGTAGTAAAAGAAAATGGLGLKIAIAAVISAVVIGVGAVAVAKNIKTDKDENSSKEADAVVTVTDKPAETVTEVVTVTEVPVTEPTVTTNEPESIVPPEDAEAFRNTVIEKLKATMPEDAGDIYVVCTDIDGDEFPELDISYSYDRNPNYEEDLKNPNAKFIYEYLNSGGLIVTFKNNEAICHERTTSPMEKNYYCVKDETTGETYGLILQEEFLGFAARTYRMFRIDSSGITESELLPQEYDEYASNERERMEVTTVEAKNREEALKIVEDYSFEKQ